MTGSGVVIEGKRILSNAHVVTYANQVQIQANQAGDRISARVEAIASGIDLAVLRLDDETFFKTHRPLPRAVALPQIKDSVTVYGYPKGGTTLSVTKGIVSRIEFVPYNVIASGLRIQIDAALNPGNSGGPAVAGDKMVGLAFSRVGDAENIGYIIPCEEIDLFLRDIADGRYHGKPALFDDLQTLENPALRAFLNPGKSVQGLVVRRPLRADAAYPLKTWDIIVKIGNTPVDDQGMIKLGSNLRIRFSYLIQKIAKGGILPLTVVRAGKEVQVKVPVSSTYPLVIPDLNNTYPSYFIYGPMVFSTAFAPFVVGFLNGEGAANKVNWLTHLGSPLVSRLGDRAVFEGEELVVVPCPFFPHRLTKGYGQPAIQVVKTINGIRIRNLRHLVEVLRDAKEQFVTIEFDNRHGEIIVLPRAETEAATSEILADNGIRSQGSPDTLAIWNAKSTK
jgi:S1-C subfamily serine protease